MAKQWCGWVTARLVAAEVRLVVTATLAAAQAPPTVTPLVNQSSFLPGQTLQIGA